MHIVLSSEIKSICPQMTLAVLSCSVVNSETSDILWAEIENESLVIHETYTLEQINKRSTISATRQVYKLLGKDPNRYRPSAESLCRRILRGLPLYRVNTLVDIINLVSIRSGFSIGGFDIDKINGEILTQGIGRNDEQFEAIGRGMLNIEGLPVYRDKEGGIGTPTSDHERTKLSLETRQLLIIINGYSGNEGLEDAVSYTLDLLKKYAALTQDNWTITYI